VALMRGDAMKSAAEGNASTVYPSTLMSFFMDSRKGSSSSTIEIKVRFAMALNLLTQTGAFPMPGAYMQLLMSAEVDDKAM